MYNEGISSTEALLDLALEKQVVEKRGSWLNYKGTQLAQGRDAAKEVLKNDKRLYEEIEAAVKAKLDEEKSYLPLIAIRAAGAGLIEPRVRFQVLRIRVYSCSFVVRRIMTSAEIRQS